MAGIALPQLAPASEDRVSGALSVDGSLRFNNTSKNYLTRTPGSAGNRKVWTLSYWIKFNGDIGAHLFSANNDAFQLEYRSGGQLLFANTGPTSGNTTSTARFRDYGQFYHVVIQHDAIRLQARIFINGEESFTATLSDADGSWNNATSHNINGRSTSLDSFGSFGMSNVYSIDGLALGPGYFGFTDPLTNTWRPKKFRAEGTTVNDGKTWSSYINGSILDGFAAANAFDGVAGISDGDCCSPANDSTLSWIPPQIIRGEKIEAFFRYNQNSSSGVAAQVFQNGVDITSTVSAVIPNDNNGDYVTLPFKTIDNVNGLSWTRTASGHKDYRLAAIRVDGVVMVDDTTTNLDFGTNGFYLPMDGNSPVGQDKSGKGNDFTPVNFGGSVELDKATGALPILNTIQGGTKAGVGVFGSEVSSTIAVTVSNATGSNKYYLGGVLNPSLAFIRGATITFDTTDSSNNSHPFKLSSTNADSSGGTEYTDGVKYYINGSSVSGSDYVSNYANNGGGTGFRGIKWTIPHNVSTTYYYCTQHNGMGNNGRLTSTTDETKADPYAWKCVVAMPLVGANGDVSDHINSTSSTKTVTTQNNAAAISRSNFYGGSFDFDGSGDRLLLSNYGSDLTFAGDFTMECWLYIDDAASLSNPNGDRCIAGVWSGSNDDWLMTYSGTGDHNTFLFQIYTGGSTVFFSSGVVMTPYVNRWVHLAVVRNSNSVQCFVDGIAKGSATSNSASFGQTSNVAVGGRTSGDAHTVTGSIQDFRIYNGVAKYTGNFVPASTNPDILPDSPAGVAVKSKLKKVTDGAVAFDGTGDEVNVPSHSDLAFGTGNFTIDCFAYFNSFDDTYPTVLSKLVGGDLSWIVRVKNDGKVVWYSKNGSGTNNESSTTPIGLRKWHHIAVVREGTGSNQLKVYVDGAVHLTMTDSNDYNDSNALCIGTQQAGGGNTINGFISNVRIIKGTALYTTDFTPPTRALTNVTNTKLLCCQSTSSAAEAAVKPGTITPGGNAAATTFNPFNDINTVRGQEGAYATFNSLVLINGGSSVFSNNNLSIRGGSTNGATASTINPTSGKHYFELDIDYVSGQTQGNMGLGVVNEYLYSVGNPSGDNYPSTFCGFFTRTEINSVVNGNETGAQTTEPTVNYTFGLAVDYDAKSMTLYLDGAKGNTVSFSSVTNPLLYFLWGNTNNTMVVNFGQKPFKFPPPDGYQPVTSSASISSDIVPNPSQFCNTVLYRGTGSDLDLDVGFQPDLSYFACRSATGYIKYIFDSVRGPTKTLATSHTQGDDAEGTAADTLKSFNSNGVTIGNNSQMNENASNTWASWHWKAGGAPTATNNNTSGAMDANSVSIDGVLQSAYTPSGSPSIYPKKMSIGTKQGFSIIQWTDQNNAQTLPHGLSQAPDFILIKDLGAEVNWSVYHSSMGNAKAMYLNNADDEFSTSRWNSTSPTANVFSWNDNTSTNDQIAYCWHNVPGLQKFGHYIGTGDDDGAYVDLGFKPAMLWVKCSSSDSQEWLLWDSKRSPHNLVDTVIYPHTNTSESDNGTSRKVDFLSNGFKLRNGSSGASGIDGRTYLYMAWAEQPVSNLYGATSTAR